MAEDSHPQARRDGVTDRDSDNQWISDSHVTPSSIRATQHNSFMFSSLFLSLAESLCDRLPNQLMIQSSPLQL
jgi:hypothetical protein